MNLFTHPKLNISLEEKNGVQFFKSTLKGIINTVVFRDLAETAIKIYEKEIPKLANNTSKILILSDSRELELLRKEDVEWLNEAIKPRLEELGITHQALIPPHAVIISDLVDVFTSYKKKGGLLNAVFKNEAECLEWFFHAINKPN